MKSRWPPCEPPLRYAYGDILGDQRLGRPDKRAISSRLKMQLPVGMRGIDHHWTQHQNYNCFNSDKRAPGAKLPGGGSLCAGHPIRGVTFIGRAE